MTLFTKIRQDVFMAFSLDNSRTSHSRYHGNTQRRHADYNRHRLATTHRHRQTRTFKFADTARHDDGPARPSQVLPFGKYRNVYRSLRRVRAKLGYR